MNKEELWKDIEGYEGLYQISSLGRVKSFIKCNAHPKIPRIMKPTKNYKGYLKVPLTKNQNTKLVSIHRLVAENFLENPLLLSEVNHIDCNKLNNDINNLEWVSHKDNIIHAQKNNRFQKLKLSDSYKSVQVAQYDMCDNFIKKWNCMKEISIVLNIQWQNIGKCCRGIRKTAGGYKWKYMEEK